MLHNDIIGTSLLLFFTVFDDEVLVYIVKLFDSHIDFNMLKISILILSCIFATNAQNEG